ncbi:MAG TPA: RecB-family nuclease [Sulfolobales archaeon]|nr:RecB-family nuclease [Sulfolobales archaeon]
MILVLHAPTSPHMVIEFIKTASVARVTRDLVIVVTRPGGLAAQSGIPEAWKHAHKSGLAFSVLPELSDAIDLYKPSEIYIFSRNREWVDFKEVEIGSNTMLIFPSGEQPLGKEGIERAKGVSFPEFSRDLGPVQSLSIALYIIMTRTKLLSNE